MLFGVCGKTVRNIFFQVSHSKVFVLALVLSSFHRIGRESGQGMWLALLYSISCVELQHKSYVNLAGFVLGDMLQRPSVGAYRFSCF